MAGPVESPNTLYSNAQIKIVDLIGEGTIAGFWPVSGVSGLNPLCSIYFDDLPLMNGDGSANYNITGLGFSFKFNSGTSGQQPLVGFEKVEALVPLPLNTRVANPPPNNGYVKNVIASINTTTYPDAESAKVTVRFPAVYTVDTTNGNTNGFDMTWAVDISTNNGQFVQQGAVMNLSDIAPSPKCTSPFLFTKIYPLPKNVQGATFYEWKIRVRRVSQNVLSTNTANEMAVDSVAVVSSNSYRYPMSAVAAYQLTADQFAAIPSRAEDIKGTMVLTPVGYTPTQYNIRTISGVFDVDTGDQNVDPVVNALASVQDIYVGAQVQGAGIPAGTTVTFVDKVGPAFYFSISANPTATNHGTTVTIINPWVDQLWAATYPGIWTGTFGPRQWTDNPAWIFYDLITNRRYGLGNYVRAEWMDKWTLYQIAQYCDELVDDGAGGFEPRFTCNVALTQSQDAYTLLNNLVSVFRGMLYWANGRINPVGPETRDPVFNFSNANAVGGAFTYADTPRNVRATICTVKWLDPTNLFRPTPERIEDIDGITKYGYIEKQLTSFATTSRGQAIRAANWFLTVEQLLTETISFQTDREGLYLRPGDVFNVYDNFRNNQKQGGRIINWGTGQQTIVLDKTVNLEPGFTYVLSALIPATNLSPTGDITGSNQVGLIRNSQIETRTVLTPAGFNYGQLDLTSGFYGELYKGSVWILNGSGNGVAQSDQSTQYKCLLTSEPQNGIVEVLGAKYQTGINYLVNNNYSAETSPPVIGDTTPPNPPTGILVFRVTGLQVDNSFFDYLYVSWSGSTSTNRVYDTLSGQLGAGAPFLIAQPTTTGNNYTPGNYGTYTFSVASNNGNGYQSAFNRVTYVRSNTNPLGTTAAMSGVFIAANWDPYYVRPSDGRYTGYVGRSPSFAWHINIDADGNQVPTAQFITGWQIKLLEVGNESNMVSNSIISVSGNENTTWNFDPGYLYTGVTVKPLRAFTFAVDSVDQYGNVASGARLAVNNPQLPAPQNSGFVGYNGGITYNVTPRAQADTSGIYLWVNQNPAFTPTYANSQFSSTNLAGSANIAPQTGSFYTWFSLADTYGFSGSKTAAGDQNATIYGPISGNANAIFGEFFSDITDQLTGAFGYLTGALNLFQTALYQTGSNLYTTVIGLSGSITGAGAISTALNISLQTAVVSASGANSTQINAVSARLVTTGQINYALAGTVMDALATTGGSNSAYLTQLSAVTTGISSTVRLVMDAFATGSVNGLGGAAQARWGFELNAAGKIASMKATINSFQSYGTATFANLNLQSDTYSPGSAGWQINTDGSVDLNRITGRGTIQSSTYTAGSAGWQINTNGNAEFNNIQARGVITGGTFPLQSILDSNGILAGNPAGDRLEMHIGVASSTRAFRVYNQGNNLAAQLHAFTVIGTQPGQLELNDGAGSAKVLLNGYGNGSIAVSAGLITTNTFQVNSTSNFDGNVQFNGDITVGTNAVQRWIYMPNGGKINWGDGAGGYDIFAYRFGANDWRLSAGGADRFVVQNGQVVCLVPLKIDNASTAITTETVTNYVTVRDSNGTTIKLAVLT